MLGNVLIRQNSTHHMTLLLNAWLRWRWTVADDMCALVATRRFCNLVADIAIYAKPHSTLTYACIVIALRTGMFAIKKVVDVACFWSRPTFKPKSCLRLRSLLLRLGVLESTAQASSQYKSSEQVSTLVPSLTFAAKAAMIKSLSFMVNSTVSLSSSRV